MEEQFQPDFTPSRLGKMVRIPVYLVIGYCFLIIVSVAVSIVYTIMFGGHLV